MKSICDFRFSIFDWIGGAALLVIAVVNTGCGSFADAPAATQPVIQRSSTQNAADEAQWKEVGQALGKSGELHHGVYTVAFPRDDLLVSIEGMEVPSAAGLASVFHFYRCSCGKTSVIGEFVLANYEANDVVYALGKEDILVSSMAPMLLYEKPRLMSVRFQAEGDAAQLARALKGALDWVGKNRLPPPKVD